MTDDARNSSASQSNAASELTDEEIDRQGEAAEARQETEHAAGRVAVSARYDAGTGRIAIEMSSGLIVEIPARMISEVSGASPELLAGVAVDPIGYGIHWEALDIDISVLGLFADLVPRDTP